MKKTPILKPTKETNLPSWLFFGLYHSNPSGKWNDDKQKTAEIILQKLKQKAEMYHWDISKIIHYEKDDNIRGYFPSDKAIDDFKDKVAKKYNAKISNS